MSKTLSEIREKIDSIDNQVHDLLMERAGLVSSVASAKKEGGMQIVQPAREARMMRRLLGRHSGPLPRATIIRIWRELVGSVALLQTGLSVVVPGTADHGAAWDMAKDYFGSSVPMKTVPQPHNAIVDVMNDDASFAVMPWPELDELNPWWSALFSGQEGTHLSVICALPYGKNKPNDTGVFERAMVVSKIDFMPSDDDVTVVGLELSGDISRARVMDLVAQQQFDVVNLYRGGVPDKRGTKLFLLEVRGFYDDGSEDLARLVEALGKSCTYCSVVGGYPVIPGQSQSIDAAQDDAA